MQREAAVDNRLQTSSAAWDDCIQPYRHIVVYKFFVVLSPMALASADKTAKQEAQRTRPRDFPPCTPTLYLCSTGAPLHGTSATRRQVLNAVATIG